MSKGFLTVAVVLCALGVVPTPDGACFPSCTMVERLPLSAAPSSSDYPQGSQPPSPSVELPSNPGVFPGDLIKPLFTLGLTAQGSSCPSERPNTRQFEQQHS